MGLLGPCGAFTESCRPLTFSLSPSGTPESSSFSPDVLSIAGMSTLLPTETGVELTGRSEDPASPRRFPDKTGQSPRTPSVVFQISELAPEDDMLSESYSDLLNTPAPFRLLPLRAPTSGKLRSSSRLAPSFDHRPTLRSTGEEDARCVEPTSATHTNYVHPHLVRSRLAPLVAQRGRPPETKAPDDTIGGPSVSRHPRPLRRTVSACLPRALIPRGLETRAWAFSSHGAHAAEPLTPLSRLPFHPQRFTDLRRCCLLLCLRHSPAFLRVGVDRRMWQNA